MIKKGLLRSDRKLLLIGTSFAAHHLWAVCIDQVREDMMIAMKDNMEAEMETEMLILMGWKEIMVLEMIVLAEMRIHMVVIMKNAITEMVTGMMIIEEEVEALMIINMVQGAGALTEMENVHMMMTVKFILATMVLELMSNLRMEGSLNVNFSEQNIGAPPSYEEAVTESGSNVQSQRDVEAPATSAPRAFPPPTSSTPSQPTTIHGTTASPSNQGFDGSDEFDPRGSVPEKDQAHFDRGESFSASTYSTPDVPVQPNLHQESLQRQNIEPGREFGNGMFIAQGGTTAHYFNSYMAPPNAQPAQFISGNFNPPQGLCSSSSFSNILPGPKFSGCKI